jgi:hypothetical protein
MSHAIEAIAWARTHYRLLRGMTDAQLRNLFSGQCADGGGSLNIWHQPIEDGGAHELAHVSDLAGRILAEREAHRAIGERVLSTAPDAGHDWNLRYRAWWCRHRSTMEAFERLWMWRNGYLERQELFRLGWRPAPYGKPLSGGTYS